jgi:hypothetical protein
MEISGSTMSDGLANMATNMQSANLNLQFSTAVLKKALDSQKQQGAALVQMINQTPSLEGTGRTVDISV